MKPIPALFCALLFCPITGHAQPQSWIYFSISLGDAFSYGARGYQIWRVRANGSDAERIFDLPIDTPDEYIDRIPADEQEATTKFFTLINSGSSDRTEAEIRSAYYEGIRDHEWFTRMVAFRVSPSGEEIAVQLEHMVYTRNFTYGFSEIVLLTSRGQESVFQLGFHNTDARFISLSYLHRELTGWYRLYIPDFQWLDDGSAIVLTTNDASSGAVEPVLPLSVIPLDSTHKPFQIGEASRWTTTPHSVIAFLPSPETGFSHQIRLIDIDLLHRTAASQTMDPGWFFMDEDEIGCLQETCFMFGVDMSGAETMAASRILSLDEPPALETPELVNGLGSVRAVETLESTQQLLVMDGRSHLRQVTYEDQQLIASEPIVEPKVTFIRARGDLLLAQFEGERTFRVLNTDGTTLWIIDPAEITGISAHEFQLMQVDW